MEKTKNMKSMKMITKLASLNFTLVLALASCGCSWDGPKNRQYQTLPKDPNRNTATAQEHNARGADHLKDGRLDDAEKEFRASLEADLFFGPAHNNLGTVYYKQKKLYLAAWEFQYAAKLMPGKAEPKNNLGMVFEAVGKLEDAAKSYEDALALEPDNVDITGNLARVYVRNGRHDVKTRQLLTDLVTKDSRPDWLSWARERLVAFGEPTSQPTTQP